MSSKNAAAARRDEIIAENINFMYGRSKENAAFDLDKRSFVKSNKFVDSLERICDFTGVYSFLMPSFPSAVFLAGEDTAYPSYEHALQASRFSATAEKQIIKDTPLIRDVKKMTSKFTSNRGELWKKECIIVAERLLRDKFIRSKELTSQLRGTGKKSIVYANSFGEHFWGCPVENQIKGQNHLGKLLEKIRSDIVKGEDIDLWLTSQLKIAAQEDVSIDLEVVKGGDIIVEDGKIFERRPKLFLGKADLNDIVTAHSSTSRTHAALVVGTLPGSLTGVETFIVDFLSSNGTFVDGSRLAPYVLTPIRKECLVTVGASTRAYRFLVDTQRNQRARELLYDKLANPDILTAKAEEQNVENTVFVGNIPFDASEADVREFFALCGPLISISMPKDKDKDGEHRGIAFVTFASSGGLLQALARGGDDLKGRSLAVKRREGKSNGNAPAAKKIAAAEKASYYGNSEGAGIGRPEEQQQEVHSRAGTRFSSSSSSSVVAGVKMAQQSASQGGEDGHKNGTRGEPSHSRHSRDRDRPTGRDRPERAHGDGTRHEVSRGGQGRDNNDQNRKRNGDDHRDQDRHRKRDRSDSPSSRPSRKGRSLSRSRSRGGDERRDSRKRSVSPDRKDSSRPRHRDSRSPRRRSKSPHRRSRSRSPLRRKMTSERRDRHRSVSSDVRNAIREGRREGRARLTGDDREAEGDKDNGSRPKVRKGSAPSHSSSDIEGSSNG